MNECPRIGLRPCIKRDEGRSKWLTVPNPIEWRHKLLLQSRPKAKVMPVPTEGESNANLDGQWSKPHLRSVCKRKGYQTVVRDLASAENYIAVGARSKHDSVRYASLD